MLGHLTSSNLQKELRTSQVDVVAVLPELMVDRRERSCPGKVYFIAKQPDESCA